MEIAIIALSSLLVISNIYWMRHSQLLVNKIMSANYRDYALGVVKEQNKDRPTKVQDIIPEDLRPLQEFNFS